ncbi:MAG: glycosyltransferase family 2 protein [Anaerolineales bacterium]
MTPAHLSIIIPAYNEAQRLPNTLGQALKFIEQQPYTSEIVVVENGSRDNTLQIAQNFAAQYPQVRVLHNAQPGKGRAVQTGMLAAHGEYRFMADADLSMPIEQVNRFLPPNSSAPIVIGSREAPGAVRYNEPAYRHWGGRFINLVIRALALPGLRDTQCGFKCFRADVARDLFSVQTIMGWAFDVEILYIARLRGYEIHELAIPWYFNPESKLNVVRDALRMMRDIAEIRSKAQRGVYAPST